MANNLLVRILGDSRSLERAFARSSKSASTFGRDMDTSSKKFSSFTKGLATGGVLGLAAREVISVVAPMIDAASDLNEQLSRTRVVFEQSSESVVAWSETTARSMGIAQAAALDAAGTFGAMFDQAGQSSEDAARLSKTVVQLASDLASFNNTTVDDALVALRSGLSGEIEPLRRFQVFLTEAAVAQQAMADTGKASSKELTQGEKILARYALILEQTGKQQGDFARTSDGLANQQRILAASVKDLQANLGTLLLPGMTKVVEAMVAATGVVVKLTDGLEALAKVKIPTITIPFDIEIGGGRLGGALGKAANIGSFIAFPGPRFAKLIADQIGDRFADDTRSVTPELAESFRRSLDTMLSDALQSASANVRTNPEDFAKLPGVDFGHADTIIGAVRLAIDKARKAVDDAVTKGNAAIAKDAAAKAGERRADTIRGVIEGLQLKVDRAELDRNLKNDLVALQALKAGLQRQIAAGVDVQSAQSQLVGVIRQIASKQEEIRAGATEAVQARQFRALGLSATGEEIVPGFKNLQTRVNNALRLVSSGQLDISSKLVQRLKLARTLIKKEGKDLTEDTRRVINDLLRTLTQGADKLADGPLTKTTSLNAGKILEGLGLGRDLEKELRARLSSFNSAGQALAGAQTVPTGTFRGGIATRFVVENHNTINLDGDTVARNVTKSQQGTRRRNPTQKRGRRSGI